jgi:hypothetical protein
MRESQQKLVLEKSTNTHVCSTPVEVTSSWNDMATIILSPKGQMIVEHGHHNTVATEEGTKQVIKITQQEYNPVLKAMQNAFD